MPSTFPTTPDDFDADDLTHGDVTDALAAVETYLGEGGRLLTGTQPPINTGDLMDPLDGVSDPWRWSPVLGSWVGPAYEVSWSEGDTVLDLSAYSEAAPFYRMDTVIAVDNPVTLAVAGTYFALVVPGVYTDNAVAVALSSGTGVAYAFQTEPGFTHTTVPDASIDPRSLFGDCVVGDLYTFPVEVGTGADGDVYFETSATKLYGPKTNGIWPAGVSLIGAAGADGVPVLVSSPGGISYRLVVADDGTLSTQAV